MMNSTVRVSFCSVMTLALLSPGLAHAQEKAGADDAAAMGAGQTVGPYAKEAYPAALIFRPLTLPRGMIEVRADFDILHVKDLDTFFGIGVGSGYGLSDLVEVGLATRFGVSPDLEWGELIRVYAAFSVMDQAQFDFSPSIGTTFNFASAETGQPDPELFTGLNIGATVRFLVNDKIFIHAGRGLIDVTINPDSGARLNLDLGAGYQVTAHFAIAVELGLASIKLFGTLERDTELFDPFSVALTALYGWNRSMDVFLSVSTATVEGQRAGIDDFGDAQLFIAGANFRL